MIQHVLGAFIFFAFLASNTLGSKESVLEWHSFRIESFGVGKSGTVTVTGLQGPRGVENMRVDAFGKSFVIKEGDLAKLGGIMANSIQLSYEPGYQELGGRTIYLLIATGFTSGTVQGKVISLTERGDIRIEDFKKP